MKRSQRVLIMTILATMILSSGDRPVLVPKNSRDPWLGLDKLKHFTSAVYMTMTAYYVQSRIANKSRNASENVSTMMTVTLGVSKEIFDTRKKDGFFSWKDVLFDVAGTAVALVFINQVK
ncbi:MAG: hypothetical protein COT43_07595 [Candidatus Marinimicrobia bacterium CG08_land_8_20_14_0_20_45_22]|nr:MAG: hypothetical protein COT43_07595 [Candidatus Marinimicrobia bacterium CG08_land_8_20_14_0_20_45_22]